MTEQDYVSDSVSTGSFIVSRKNLGIVKAHLGVSLGIALIDKSTGTCGICHILLPEPLSQVSPQEPLKYASTAVPEFLNAMYDEGAKRESMEATLAGGALVGTVSQADIEMDIGGNSTEIVEKLLAQEGIPIVRTETGGYFSCVLSLDFGTRKCDIEPLTRFTESTLEPVKKISAEELDKTIGCVRPIPQIAFKIIRMIHSRDYSMKDVGREVKLDQVISARVLKVCNSALFSFKVKIDSINQALTMMGEKTVLRLVVSTAVEQFFSETERGYSLCRGGLYHHATGTALVAENLANLTGKSFSDVAYTAGLLHDIGKVVLDQYVVNLHPLFYRKLHEDELSLLEVEREVLGVTHTEVGARLAELWTLPDILREAIVCHHAPGASTLDPELTHLVYLADLLMSRFQVGFELERIDASHLGSTFEILGLTGSNLHEIIDYIPWKSIGQ